MVPYLLPSVKVDSPQTVWAADCPQQANLNDCGLYAIVSVLRLVLGVDTAQDLTRADAAAWRIALRALSEKESLNAVMPSKPQTKLTLSEIADARAGWQSPAAATGQGEWAEDANAAIQPFIQEAISVTKAYCMVYKERKQEAEELDNFLGFAFEPNGQRLSDKKKFRKIRVVAIARSGNTAKDACDECKKDGSGPFEKCFVGHRKSSGCATCLKKYYDNNFDGSINCLFEDK